MTDMCRITQQRLPAYLDGELPPDEHAQVDSHLARCAACNRELTALRQMDVLLTSWEAPTPTARVTTLFETRLAERRQRQSRWTGLFHGNWQRLGWAAGMAAVLIVSIILHARLTVPIQQSLVMTQSGGEMLPIVSSTGTDRTPSSSRYIVKTSGKRRIARAAHRSKVHHPVKPVSRKESMIITPSLPDELSPVLPEPGVDLTEAPGWPEFVSLPMPAGGVDRLESVILASATPESAVANMTAETGE